MGHLYTANGPSRSWTWRAVSVLTILVLAGCSGRTPPSETPSPGAAAGSCPAIDLRTPQGNHIDLSGEWRGSASSYAISQIGSCVWFVALSRWPDHAAGEDWLFAFQGTLALDFTMSGEWAMVYLAEAPIRPTGRLAYLIEFDDTAGVEEIILRRLDVSPSPAVIDRYLVADFPAEELRRVP